MKHIFKWHFPRSMLEDKSVLRAINRSESACWGKITAVSSFDKWEKVTGGKGAAALFDRLRKQELLASAGVWRIPTQVQIPNELFITLGLLWHGHLSPIHHIFIESLQQCCAWGGGIPRCVSLRVLPSSCLKSGRREREMPQPHSYETESHQCFLVSEWPI